MNKACINSFQTICAFDGDIRDSEHETCQICRIACNDYGQAYFKRPITVEQV